jgi:hypothetical protein
MKDIHVGEFVKFPARVIDKGETEKVYGVIGKEDSTFEPCTFCYFWKTSVDPELRSLEEGWIGRMEYKENGEHFSKSLAHFMSPFQFLECVEMHYRFSSRWSGETSDKHLETFKREMEKLALQSSRRGKIAGNKYGL